MDIYKILGVNSTASRQEISIAFRNKAKKIHPDVNGGNIKFENEFKILNEAYKAALEYLDNNNNFSVDYSYNSPKRMNSVKEIHLTIAQAINGTKYKIEGGNGLCDTCNGKGDVRLKHPIMCPYCGGTGNSAYKNYGPLDIKVVCSHCDGSGKTTIKQCSECHGYGTKSGNDLIVELPSGTIAGDIFIVENGYSNSDANIVGDLELVISINNDDKFKLYGLDVFMQVPINIWDAVLGVKKNIIDPVGVEHEIVVRPGTIHGTRIKIQDMGLRRNTNEGEKGNLIGVVSIIVPSVSDPKIKEAFSRLQKMLN